ncbi:complement decay-accelerating factor [Echinops telfairi]|uniref:Complement decay-accelerating factor n=1 Tax=Echinops telfairi TaxID=9371 RepID=A0AC55DQV2_ECHTE|nr:complement decay-accelerating factor [Echinops telfairi]
MSSAAVLKLLAALAWLLLLLGSPAAVRGGCGFPPYVPNARPTVGSHNSFPVRKIIRYTCNKGFAKIPGQTDAVACLDNNQWSKISTLCNRSCDAPPILLVATFDRRYVRYSYFPVGFTVEYQCRQGYQRIESVPATITCLTNVTWSKLPNICKRKACPEPGPLKHGHINITDKYFGAQIFFSCEEGYILEGATYTFCAVSGASVAWRDPLPECKVIFCPEPPSIENGKITQKQNDYASGQSVTYQCNENFTLLGSNSIQCSIKKYQGQWTGALPRCKEIFCPEPPHIDHGKVMENHSHYRYGQSATYQCNEGFTLAGNNSIRCTEKDEQGQWSDAPQCKEIFCPEPLKINNGKIVQKQDHYAHGQSITYVCDEGLILIGKDSIQCTVKDNQGKWSDFPPKCKERLVLWPAVAPQKHATSTAQPPPKAPNPTSAKVSGTKAPPTPQEITSVNDPDPEPTPAAQKPTSANFRAAYPPLTARKPTAANLPAVQPRLAARKPTSANIPAADHHLTARKPTSPKLPAADSPLTAQKPTSPKLPAADSPLTAQKPTAANLPAADSPLTAQKPTAANLPPADPPRTAQKPTSANLPPADPPLTAQKPTAANLPPAEPPLTAQKPTAASVSVTQVPATGQKSPVTNALPTETSPAFLKPITANASSVAHATPTTQQSSTANVLVTQTLPTKHKSTAAHAPVTKRLKTTQTSAPVTATRVIAVPRATTHFQATHTAKGKGTLQSSGAIILASGNFWRTSDPSSPSSVTACPLCRCSILGAENLHEGSSYACSFYPQILWLIIIISGFPSNFKQAKNATFACIFLPFPSFSVM